MRIRLVVRLKLCHAETVHLQGILACAATRSQAQSW